MISFLNYEIADFCPFIPVEQLTEHIFYKPLSTYVQTCPIIPQEHTQFSI